MIMSVIALGKIADRQRHPARSAAIGIGMLVLVFAIAWRAISWDDIGRCLPGLALLYLGWHVVILFRSPGSLKSSAINLRLLFAVLAVALISRMLLNGRIYHYGFYQAAMAGAIVPAVLLGESTDWAGVERRGRAIITLGFLALLLPGVAILMAQSKRAWQMSAICRRRRVGLVLYISSEKRADWSDCADCREVLESATRRSDLVGIARGLDGELSDTPPLSPRPVLLFQHVHRKRKGGGRCSSRSYSANHPISLSLSAAIYDEFGINRYGEAPVLGDNCCCAGSAQTTGSSRQSVVIRWTYNSEGPSFCKGPGHRPLTNLEIALLTQKKCLA